ncbi:MAG TPA: hypothetical protein VGB58_08470 [Blastococcus sp.]|jgi:hypothetical protein
MISMTPTWAPADLPGLGGFDVRPAFGPGLCTSSAELVAVHLTAPAVPVQGTGLPAGSAAVRRRPLPAPAIGHDVVTGDSSDHNTTFENDGTTLGIHSSRRPQS